MAAERGWQRKFEDPIPLPNGDKLHATFLPVEQAALPEWQAAMEA
jgi:hypothetical protein